jgi:replicative DNA helicase
VFLKGHAGDLMRVGRLSRDSEQVDKPSPTMGLAVQPETLRDIPGMPGFRGLGLLARILFAFPENTVGFRKIGADPIPTEVAADYHTGLHALVLTLAGWTDPAALVLRGS